MNPKASEARAGAPDIRVTKRVRCAAKRCPCCLPDALNHEGHHGHHQDPSPKKPPSPRIQSKAGGRGASGTSKGNHYGDQCDKDFSSSSNLKKACSEDSQR